MLEYLLNGIMSLQRNSRSGGDDSKGHTRQISVAKMHWYLCTILALSRPVPYSTQVLWLGRYDIRVKTSYLIFWLVDRAISNDHLKVLVNISKLLQTTSNGIVKNTVTTYAAHDGKIKKFVENKLAQMMQIGSKIMNDQEIETLRSLVDTDNAVLPAYAEQIKEEALTKLYDGLMQTRPSLVRSRSDSQWVS